MTRRACFQCSAVLQQAKEGVLGGLDEDDDFVIDTAAKTAEVARALGGAEGGGEKIPPTGTATVQRKGAQARNGGRLPG